MQHKNDYSVVVYFEIDSPKRWTYVHKLNGFSLFLNQKFPTWKYLNIYDRRSGQYLKRLYKGNFIPAFLTFFFLTFSINNLYQITFNNGFNNTATIPILC